LVRAKRKGASKLLKINMFSKADTVEGQGVGSAYLELIDMLKAKFPNEFDIKINDYQPSDISHYHTVNPQYYLSTFQKKKRGVKVGYVHFLPDTLEGSISLPGPAQKIFAKYVVSFYKRMDELVVVNPSFIPELGKYGIDTKKVTYIPNFVSQDDFYLMSKVAKAEFRETLEIGSEELIVLGVGQIQYRKGIDDFIQLAKDNPNIQFIWAGGFSFGKITSGYEKYKAVYDNPPKNLLFTGIISREELVNYYNVADVFLLPSYNELFPMSILEAFNCQTAVMLRDLDLYHDVIGERYLPCDDRAAMQKNLRAIDKDRSLLLPYVEQSRKAAGFYSKNNLAKIWYDYYTGLVAPQVDAVEERVNNR
jgi:1,2-diacylglycerol-3-alpha-glucose alpha-1,2-galactosyltransferase